MGAATMAAAMAAAAAASPPSLKLDHFCNKKVL